MWTAWLDEVKTDAFSYNSVINAWASAALHGPEASRMAWVWFRDVSGFRLD